MIKALLVALLIAPAGAAPAKTARLRFPSGKAIVVDVVDSPASRERGLMDRKKLPKDYGMLFVFPAERMLQFWMKDTWVSLDIVFMGRDKAITVVHERLRPSTEYTTDETVARAGGRGQFVLELPAGAAKKQKLKAGQKLVFEAVIPRN